MRILYYSDIHLEIWAHQTTLATEWTKECRKKDLYPLWGGPDLSEYKNNVDLVILAGDIGYGYKSAPSNSFNSTSRYNRENIFSYCEQVHQYLGVPVLFIPGNHEYYHSDFSKVNDELSTYIAQGVHILMNNDYVIHGEKKSLRILGTTLWTGFDICGDGEKNKKYCKRAINDFRVIKNGNDILTPNDIEKEYHKSKEWIYKNLEEKFDGKTIVVTHFPPSNKSLNPDYTFEKAGHYSGFWETQSYFCSNIDLDYVSSLQDELIWVYGHDHYSQNWQYKNIEFKSCQYGYPGEHKQFKGLGIIELDI